MSNKVLITTLSAIIATGLGSQAIAAPNDAASTAMQNKTKATLMQEMPAGFEKCYGIAKAGKNDCASGTEACAGQAKSDNSKDAWLGLPKGTCERIVGGSTSEGSAS